MLRQGQIVDRERVVIRSQAEGGLFRSAGEKAEGGDRRNSLNANVKQLEEGQSREPAAFLLSPCYAWPTNIFELKIFNQGQLTVLEAPRYRKVREPNMFGSQ